MHLPCIHHTPVVQLRDSCCLETGPLQVCLHLHAPNATASLTVAKHYGLRKIVLHSILRNEFDALKSTQENEDWNRLRH